VSFNHIASLLLTREDTKSNGVKISGAWTRDRVILVTESIRH